MKKFQKVICLTCGEKYNLADSSFKKSPLEVCGECGGNAFVNYSRNPIEGFSSVEQYYMLQDLIPERLKPGLGLFLEELIWMP